MSRHTGGGRTLLAPGLARLLRLRLGAARRETLRRLRTPAGVALLAGGVLVVAAFVALRALLPAGDMMPPGELRVAATFFLAGVVLLQVLTRGEGDVLGFTPAEADQLFGAPYRPEEILRYKLALMLVAVTSTSLFSAPFFMIYGRRADTTLVFALLVTTMIQLGSMTVALLLRVGRRPKWIAAGVVAAVAAPLLWRSGRPLSGWSDLLALGEAILAHPVGAVVLAPAWSAASLLAADAWSEALPHAALLLAVDVGLLALLLRLGRGHWVELAADGAQHIGAVVERVRGGSLLGATSVRLVRLPRVPRLGGVGPLARRQLAEVLRRPATLLLLLGFALFPQMLTLLMPIPSSPELARQVAVMLVTGTAVILVVGQSFVPTLLRTDFRGDLDRLDLLLALPIPRWALIAGQVLPGALVLTVLGGATTVALLLRTAADPGPALALLLVQPVVALWQLTVENVVFLLLPHRLEMGEAAIEGLGKGVLTYVIGQTLTWSVGVASMVVGVLVSAGGGLVAGALVADALLLMAVATVGAVGWVRLRTFDPTVHLR